MNEEEQFYIEVKPILIYPKCYVDGRLQDCANCELYKNKRCQSPIGQCMCNYDGHKKGCPNYGKKMNCPPNMPMFDQVFDVTKPVYAIFHIFDLKAHVERMKEKHPNWSEKQLRCSLYWQGTAKKMLKEKSSEFLKLFKNQEYVLISSPESMGVDVTRTMKKVGIILEWPVMNNVYKINFAGQLLDQVKDKEYIKNRRKQITDKGYLVLEQPVGE